MESSAGSLKEKLETQNLRLKFPQRHEHRFSIFNFRVPSVAVALAELYGDIHFLSAAIQSYVDGIAGTVVIQNRINVELVGHFLAVNRYNYVAADIEPLHAR